MTMTNTTRGSLVRSALPAYLSIAAALVAVVLIGVWGANRDLADLRRTFLLDEIGRVRSHAIRTVSRLEDELQQRGSEMQLSARNQFDWLERRWRRVMLSERQRLCAAVVDVAGVVVMHTDPQRVGTQLEPEWRGRYLPGIGDGDVLETRSAVLSGGRPAFDIVIPIKVNDNRVGEYHSVLDQHWFELEIERLQPAARNFWIRIIASIVLVFLVAALWLHRITKRAAAIQQAISMARVKQLSDLGRLVGALAHEIRNPLNALRLNLHTIRQVHQNDGVLSSAEVGIILGESDTEIDRLSELMKTMLGYARTDQPNVEDVDLKAEVEAIARFLGPVMQQDAIEFRRTLPDSPTVVRIDRDRFRQVLLNLLNNAREAAGKGGRR
jgi:hypothetical protein